MADDDNDTPERQTIFAKDYTGSCILASKLLRRSRDLNDADLITLSEAACIIEAVGRGRILHGDKPGTVIFEIPLQAIRAELQPSDHRGDNAE